MIFLAVCALAGGAFIPSEITQASADVLLVTNTNDAGPGSLRGVIASAAPGDQIDFAPSVTGVITLTSGQLVIDKPLVINGPGAAMLAVSGNNASRVISVTTGGNVTLAGLALQNGFSAGQNGGGIYNAGVLTLTHAAVVSNVTSITFPGSAPGGGIFNAGTITLISSMVSGNAAGSGGALYTEGLAVISATRMLSNSVFGAGGGGIFNRGSLTMTDSQVLGNIAVDGAGGGIYNMERMRIEASLIAGNVSDGPGGGGAIRNGGQLNIVNSTLSGNRATTGGTVNAGGGGAIAQLANEAFIPLVYVDILNSTIVSNTAAQVISNTSGIWATVGDVILTNSIVALNGIRQNFAISSGLVTSRGHNLSDGDIPSAVVADKVNTIPQIGPLADNGGLTPTHALLPSSMAINAGSQISCPSADQRGVARPQAGVCDIGAYERIYTNSLWLPFLPVK